MKKRIPTIIILSLCAIYLSVMPVMAQERSTTDQGLTLTFPDTYTSFSKDEYIQMEQEEASADANNNTGLVNELIGIDGWKAIANKFAGQILGEVFTNDSIQEDADNYFDDSAQFVISHDLEEDICSVYKISDKMYDLSDWSCYDIREYLFSDDNGRINKFLKNKKYNCIPEDAEIVEPSNGSIPYIQISGEDTPSSYQTNRDGYSYILTEFLHDGYEYRIFLEYNGTIPDETRDAYNGIINSAIIADSPNNPEPKLKYDSILKTRVELTD